jgi:hypothetical protein
MNRSGLSHLLSFLVSLLLAHALLVLLKAYIPPAYAFSLRFGQAIALLFKITYDAKAMAAFVLATMLAYLVGMLFHKLFRFGR